MIPKNLKDWNYELVLSMLTKGLFESESFDYKECLPSPKDEKGKRMNQMMDLKSLK